MEASPGSMKNKIRICEWDDNSIKDCHALIIETHKGTKFIYRFSKKQLLKLAKCINKNIK